MENTLLLIDGSSFVFRAFYAVRSLNAPNGMPTNAIYGVINMLKQLQKKYKTTKLVCVFDSKGKTFRDELYPEYKANRRETPLELIQQLPYIHEIITHLGIPLLIQDGVEADDLIATIATKYAAQNYRVLIATGDKDFAQIVNDKIILINTMTNEILDVKGVEEKFGVTPAQIIDYLSLIGDTADNVPGVQKCGPKTAQKWLNEYGSIANLIVNQDKLSGVVGENFRKSIEWLAIAKQLITIDCEIAITALDISCIANLECTEQNFAQLIPIYQELNFRSWLKEALSAAEIRPSALAARHGDDDLFAKLETSVTPTAETVPDSFNSLKLPNSQKIAAIAYLNNCSELDSVLTQIVSSGQPSAFNLYLDDYSDISSPIVLVSIATANQLWIIPLNADSREDLLQQENYAINLNSPAKMALLASYWSGNSPKICSNLKLNQHILARFAIELKNIVGDIGLASYIQRSQQTHDLAAVIQRYAPIEEIYSEVLSLGKGAKRTNLSTLAAAEQEKLLSYLNCNLLAAHQAILASLSREEQYLYHQVELPLASLLFKLEQQGMLINIPRLKTMAQEMHSRLNEIEHQLHFEAKTVFNVNSPKQLQDVLFSQLKLPTTGIKKNSSGYSTNEESLNILAESGFSIATLLLEYRYLSKLLNTYINRLPEYADRDGRVHTCLEQTVVSSGRLSSKDPNLQNIPVKSEYGQAIRECFIAKPGYQLICADYSQIELRILAHISQDPSLIQAFKEDADIHQITASQIFHKSLTAVTKEERRYAKSINFGLIYGKSVFGLAKELKIERSAAKLYIDNYFARFPLVKEYMEQIKADAHQHGYVQTTYGRKIYLNNINSSNIILRQAEERLALNAPMQGSAADIMKIAMLTIDDWLATENLQAKMLLQVHDELIFEAPNHEVAIILKNLPRLMAEQPIPLAVPLNIEVKAGLSWGAAH